MMFKNEPFLKNDDARDLNGDGCIDSADIGLLLIAWNAPDADLNGDGNTNGADLTILLSAWGDCPTEG